MSGNAVKAEHPDQVVGGRTTRRRPRRRLQFLLKDRLLASPAGLVPAYQSPVPARASTFRTFDTCHLPPRAVRTPRLLRAMAS
jgi:hypothetical protein